MRSLLAETARECSFSGAVRVMADREIVASEAFGLADRTHGVDNTPGTRFGCASGTKLFTALGIGALIDDGRLTLDTPLHDVATFDLSGVSHDVTVEHLLSHTSGVYDYYDEERIEDFDAFELSIPPHRLLSPLDYLPMVVGGEMKFPPGARFSYSNGGYVLLGMVIQQLCGDFHGFIRSRVLGRAGMESSGFFRFDRLPEGTANGYIETDSGWRTNVHALPIIGGPDGGAFITTADMERLWKALFSGRVLSPGLTRRFIRKAARAGDDLFYGHGMWIRDDGVQPPVIFVQGADAGVSFASSCHGDNIIATVAGNTSRGAWPMTRAVDAFIRREYAGSARAFSFAL